MLKFYLKLEKMTMLLKTYGLEMIVLSMEDLSNMILTMLPKNGLMLLVIYGKKLEFLIFSGID